MTNVQLYLATGVPLVAILISMSLSLIQIGGIRSDMRVMRAGFREDMRALRGDLSTLTGKVIEIDNRLTRIEVRMEHGRS